MKKKGDFIERKKAAMLAKAEVWQDRVAELLVVLLICVQPLYFNTARYIRLTWHKFVFFTICMCVVLLGVLIIWVFRLTRKPLLLPQGKPVIADWAVLGFAAVTLVSAIFSPFRSEASVWVGVPERYDGAFTQLMYVAAFFIVSRWYKPRTRDFAIFGISAILIALIGIFQFYGMDFFKLWPNDRPEWRVDNFYSIFFRSTLGNVDIVSTYVCVAVLLCGFLFVRGAESKWRPLWLAGSALNFWLMDLAGADSGRVGALAAAVLAMPFIIENRKTIGRFLILGSSWLAVYTLQNLFYDRLIQKAGNEKSLILFTAVFIVLLAAGAVLIRRRERDPGTEHDVAGEQEGESIGAAPAPVKWKLGVVLIAAIAVIGVAGIEALGRRDAETENPGRLYEFREMLHGNVKDEFATNRIYIWRHALAVFPKNPIIGSGPDTFENAFPPEAQYAYGENYDKAHNEYIQILICQGILGLACYLVFLGGVLYKPMPAAFKDPILMAVLAAFAGYCVQAFFNISLPIASQVLWVFAGILSKAAGHSPDTVR